MGDFASLEQSLAVFSDEKVFYPHIHHFALIIQPTYAGAVTRLIATSVKIG
jgi:hypothetical protein